MTTDLEQRIRRTLDEDVGEAPRVERAPAELRRRVRRRQTGTAAFTVAGLAAVVALTFAGLQAFDGDDRFTPMPAEENVRPVFERTATIEGFTVTAPSDWYLVDYWPVMGLAQEITEATMRGETIPGSEWIPGAAGVPVLQLTSYDPGLGAPICGSPTGDDPFPADGAGVYVALDTGARLGEGFRPWPNTIELEPPSCDGGTEVRFGIRRGDRMVPYLMWYGAGPDASEEATAQLDAIVSSLVAERDQPQLRVPGTDVPGFVLWGGTNDDGSTWTIEARPTDVNVDLKLVTRELDGTYSEGGYADFDVPPKDVEGGFMGVVNEHAERVEFRPADGSAPAIAQLTDLPASLGYAADAYWFPEGYPTKDAPADGDLVAVMPGAAEVPEPAPRPVRLSGEELGTTWSAEFWVDDATRLCVTTTIDGDDETRCGDEPTFVLPPGDPLPPPRIDGIALVAGTLPSGMVSIERGDGLDGEPFDAQCSAGPEGAVPDRYVCAVALAPSGQATLLLVGKDPAQLAESPITWGEQTAPISPQPPTATQVIDGRVGLTAMDIAWVPDQIAAAPGRPFTIEIGTRDVGVPHNFVLFDRDGSGRIAETNVTVGPHEYRVDVPALDAGTYPFRCDVHPSTMLGEIVVA